MNNSEHRQSIRNDALHIKAPTMIAIKIPDLYRARRNRVERASSRRKQRKGWQYSGPANERARGLARSLEERLGATWRCVASRHRSLEE